MPLPPARAVRLALLLAALAVVSAAVLAAQQTTAAARRPLPSAFGKIEAKGEGYEMHTDPASGDVLIRYEETPGKWVRAVYVTANKLAVVVAAAVDELPGHVLRYRYRLTSSAESRQRAVEIAAEAAGPIVEVHSPARWKWAAVAWKSMIQWGQYDSTSRGIAPGKSADGFSFQSATVPGTRRTQPARDGSGYGYARSPGALPGIVRCSVLGDAPIPSFPSEPPEGVNQALPGPFADGVAGSTVGPVEIPEAAPIPKLAAAMSGYVQPALDLGWIDGSDTAGRYTAALTEVRRLLASAPLQAGRPGPVAARAAAAQLRTLAGQVAADEKAGRVTSETSALLGINARYLLAALEAPQ